MIAERNGGLITMIDKLFEGINYTMSFAINSLPASEQQIDALLKITRQLANEPEYVLELKLNGHDDPNEFLLAHQGEGYKMVLVFPMDDFGWRHPLLLAGENLSYDEAADILHGICIEGKDTGAFTLITDHFKNATDKVWEE